MSFRRVMEVLFPEASKIIDLKLTRTQACEDSREKKDTVAQPKISTLISKQTESTTAIEPDFYDVTFKLQA